MINIVFPVINKIDYWISFLLTSPLQNLFWGLFAGALAFIVYLTLSNQSMISNIKDEMKLVRKQMFDPSLEKKSEYNILAKRNLTLSFKLLGKIFLPAILSIIPIVIIAIWYDMHHSYYIPFAEEPVVINTQPKGLDFVIDHLDLTSEDLTSTSLLHPQSKSDSILIFSNGNLIYSDQPFSVPVPIITKKNWWNFILGSPIGYIIDDSPVETLVFKYPEKIQFNKLPKIIDGWELFFFFGIFISAITLRIVFKVK